MVVLHVYLQICGESSVSPLASTDFGYRQIVMPLICLPRSRRKTDRGIGWTRSCLARTVKGQP